MGSIDVKEATPFRNLQKFGIGQGGTIEFSSDMIGYPLPALGVLFDRIVSYTAVPGLHIAISLRHPRRSHQQRAQSRDLIRSLESQFYIHSCNTRPAQCTKNYNRFHQQLYDYASAIGSGRG
jgi:hypothetical protein